MTHRFKFLLFVALAAGIGLHLRPCVGCIAGFLSFGGDAAAVDCVRTETLVQGGAMSSPGQEGSGSTMFGDRPALTSLAAAVRHPRRGQPR